MTTEEKIKVMQAYADGKQIEMRLSHLIIDGAWVSCEKEPAWDWDTMEYRIKLEESRAEAEFYKPYINTDEMIADFKERFKVDVPPYAMPLIWVDNASFKGDCNLITNYGIKGVCVDNGIYSLGRLFKEYTYLDGSPCGKLVEE